MSEYVFRVYREYEGRTVNTEYAKNIEKAKDLGRDMISIEESPEWIETGHWQWKIQNYGERNENVFIHKHILKG